MSCSKVSLLAAADAKFSTDLYRALSSSLTDQNLFLSPYSILSVMSMAYMGARGTTATQMMQVLKLTEISETVHIAFQEYLSVMTGKAKGCELATANKLFVRKDKQLCPEFSKKAAQYFGAETDSCDFMGNPESECAKINTWVAKQTHNKIQGVISPLSLTEDTSMILVNAIYFKGKWTNVFDKVSTRKASFTVSSSKKVSVDMMNTIDTFGYSEIKDLDCTALELPYVGDKLSMVILLPRESSGLTSLEQNLKPHHLQFQFTSLEEVNVSMPRFKMESSFELADVLSSLGLTTAFDPLEANFSGIDPSGLLTVSKVVHKTFVEVNEEGTEAAACTMMDCVDGFMIQKEIIFKADHPFLFFIRDRQSGMILFLGRIVNPEGLETD
ncbi:leukocyte elastase inhibitor-like isoform X7 [Haliotis rufescens]|uniref:leukocyte elastase inhibitor-like isoform X7 n=1 Tax=Haliotis rufescens TaxID=6454 RepID=UPI00201F960F|nr:leukocyte elastase inhibitor-like isoform X7 [Haliotis rufescens]